MSRLFYHVMQDSLGNLLFGVSGTMRLAGTGTLATIYGDPSLTIPLPNPMTNHASYGSFKCYVGPGSYDFSMAKAGYTFETLTGIQGLGTMANQNSSAVSIEGTLQVGGLLTAFADMRLNSHLGLNTPPSSYGIDIRWIRSASAAMLLQPADSDSLGPALLFSNLAAGVVGSIATNATTTAYNTSSDARLKHDVDDLTGELALIQTLRPVRFKWNADDSDGCGFLAHEVAAHVAGVITGEADAVDASGAILPQQIDYSKLVPYLVGAIKTLAARVAVLEDAAGI